MLCGFPSAEASCVGAADRAGAVADENEKKKKGATKEDVIKYLILVCMTTPPSGETTNTVSFVHNQKLGLIIGRGRVVGNRTTVCRISNATFHMLASLSLFIDICRIMAADTGPRGPRGSNASQVKPDKASGVARRL